MSRLATDILRILAAAFIIFNHGSWIYFDSIATSHETPSAWLVAAINQFGKPSVLFFIFLSGLAFGAHKVYSQSSQILYFYRQRFLRIVPPFILVSLGGFALRHNRFENFWPDIVLGNAMPHLYFIPLIFSLYMLFPLLQRLKFNTISVLLMTGILSVSEILTRLLPDLNHQLSQWIIYFGYSIPVFTAGIWISRTEERKKVLPLYLLVILFSATYLLTFYDFYSHVQSGMRPDPAGRIWRLSVLAYTGVWILLFFHIPLLKPPKWLRRVARASFLVYLIHPFFIWLIESNHIYGHPVKMVFFYLIASWVTVFFLQFLALRFRIVGLFLGEGDLHFKKHD